MSDESDLPENPPASLIPRSAGGTPPPQRRAPSRAPQNTGSPYTSVPPTPWGTSAVPNVPPKRTSSPPQGTHVPAPRPPTAPPFAASKPPVPTPGSAPATGSTSGLPSTYSQPPFGGHASTRSKAPIPMPSSRPPFDVLMPTPKKPFSLPPYTLSLIKMLFGFTVLLVICYCALVALNPKARKWATQKDGPTPFKALNQILAIPAQAIGKTKDVVATNDARVGALDRVITDSEKGKAGPAAAAKPLEDPFGKPATDASAARAAAAAGKEDNAAQISREALLAMAEQNAHAAEAPKPAPVRPAVVEAPPPPGPAELNLGGGVAITNSSPAGAPAASSPFMYWVAGLTVSGVSNGSPARFLMNGRLVREGDEVNKQLAITFERVDAPAKLIYFRDKGGAIVTRSY